MARKLNDVQKFKRKDKVVAAVALPGAPIGTPGRVYYEAGLSWIRYHVRFENGVELSNIDGNALMTQDEWDEARQAEQRALRKAERDARPAPVVVAAGPRGH